MANSPQKNVSSHVLVVFRKKWVGQHHYHLYHSHQCCLLQTDNDEHSWLPPSPSVVSYLLVCFLACVSGSFTSPSMSFSSLCRDLSGSQFLSLSSLSSFTQSLFCHLAPFPPPPPISPTFCLPLTPLSLSVSLTVCIASSLSVYFSLVA